MTLEVSGELAVPLRNARERVLQTLLFEATGLLLVTPLVASVTGAQAGESLRLLAALSVAVMLWAAIYNSVFDRVEARLAGRVASARPHRLRMLHAVGQIGRASCRERVCYVV